MEDISVVSNKVYFSNDFISLVSKYSNGNIINDKNLFLGINKSKKEINKILRELGINRNDVKIINLEMDNLKPEYEIKAEYLENEKYDLYLFIKKMANVNIIANIKIENLLSASFYRLVSDLTVLRDCLKILNDNSYFFKNVFKEVVASSNIFKVDKINNERWVVLRNNKLKRDFIRLDDIASSTEIYITLLFNLLNYLQNMIINRFNYNKWEDAHTYIIDYNKSFVKVIKAHLERKSYKLEELFKTLPFHLKYNKKDIYISDYHSVKINLNINSLLRFFYCFENFDIENFCKFITSNFVINLA